jgi:hypothetical protein
MEEDISIKISHLFYKGKFKGGTVSLDSKVQYLS